VRLAIGSAPTHLLVVAALVLVVAAIVASVTPAARASRVDVVCALKAE
jgi:ABC-type lipoprotein release transport system permease subunit